MNFSKAAILSTIAFISLSAQAETKTITECNLNTWCPLPRTSDVANIPVTRHIGKSYRCTLSVDGKSNPSAYVLVSVQGIDGYKFEISPFSALQGGSAIGDVKGEFDSSKKGKISIRRQVSSTSNENANVMCEKISS